MKNDIAPSETALFLQSQVSPDTVAPVEKQLTCGSQDGGHQIRALSRRFELC